MPDVDMSKLTDKERKRIERARRFGIDTNKPFEDEDASTYVSTECDKVV